MTNLAQSLTEYQYQQLITSLYYCQQELVLEQHLFWKICEVFGITKMAYIREIKKPIDVPPSVQMVLDILKEIDKNTNA